MNFMHFFASIIAKFFISYYYIFIPIRCQAYSGERTGPPMFENTKIVAFDLDGTLTQHKSKLGDKNKSVLDRLSKKYKLIMVGAGTCPRIWNQMNCYPIDVIGSYGLQYASYNAETKQQDLQWDEKVPVDREEIMRRAMLLRDKYDLHDYAGEPMEFHPTGALTFPVLGTKAQIEDKLAYDPDRAKRRPGYPRVCELFSDYTVFIGGSSSYDIVPHPYNKLYALDRFCEQNGYTREDVVYFGDDYGPGGNDFQVYDAGVDFITIDNYHDFGKRAQQLLDAVKE